MLGAGLQIPKLLVRGLLPPDDGSNDDGNHPGLESCRVQVCTLHVCHVLVILHTSLGVTVSVRVYRCARNPLCMSEYLCICVHVNVCNCKCECVCACRICVHVNICADGCMCSVYMCVRTCGGGENVCVMCECMCQDFCV